MPMSVMSARTHEEGCAEYCTCAPPPVYSRTPSGSGSPSRQSRYDAQEAAVRGRRRRPLAERPTRSRASEIAWPNDAPPTRAKVLTYAFEGKLAYVKAAASHEEALEAALAVFPSLCHVRRERIRLHVRFLNPDADAQSLVEVAVSPEAWSELVGDLPPYNVVHISAPKTRTLTIPAMARLLLFSSKARSRGRALKERRHDTDEHLSW
ncbi:hypothetical protein PENSPDRAFT_76050 [Peniophora sp. CONT]|nr:hypothetical protein PENSPDRAFT_76050 [Peniophora sp. CONT]